MKLGLVVCLLAMYLMDTFQVLLRTLAGLLNISILGAHLGSVVMLLNRAATAAVLLLIGYMVDIGVPARELLTLYAGTALLLGAAHALFLGKRRIFNLTLLACRWMYRKTGDADAITLATQEFGKKRRLVVQPVVALVGTIALAGFLLPSIAAAVFPHYRATLMQTGFIINSIASIISVLHVERRISMVIDDGDPARINHLYDAYVMSRGVGYIAGFAPFAAVLFFLSR